MQYYTTLTYIRYGITRRELLKTPDISCYECSVQMMYLVFTAHQPCHLQKWESAGSEHAYYVSSILLQCILPSLIVFIAYYR